LPDLIFTRRDVDNRCVPIYVVAKLLTTTTVYNCDTAVTKR